MEKHEKVLLIMDNVQMHFSKLMRPFYQKTGLQILRLPKYSPQLNPIETYWRNIKQWIGLNITLSVKQLQKAVETALIKDSLIPNVSDY